MNCNKCGELLPDNAPICPNCGQPVGAEVPAPQQDTPKKPENVATGVVGALLGAALGAGAIIGLGQLGYVASISGFILAVCTLKGYELLGGQLTKKGILISILLMLVTPYLADRIDWALMLINEVPEATFAEAFNAIPALLEAGAIESGNYYGNLAMVYLFTAMGAFSTIRGLFKKK